MYPRSRNNNIKGKAIPVTGREDPQGCETLRLPHLWTIGSQMAVRLSVLRACRPPFTPRKILME
jgi:hypothetical protein